MPATGEGLRLDVSPFQPDGGCPFLGTIGLFFAAMFAGGSAGWIVERLLGGFGCFCCIAGPIQVAFISFAIGLIGSLAVRHGKIRNPRIAGFAGLTGVAVSGLAKLYGEYEHALRWPEIFFFQDREAVRLIRAGNFDFLDYLYFVPAGHLGLIGLGLLIGAGGCYAIMQKAASQPFCVHCHNWKVRYPLAWVALTRGTVVRIVDEGTLVELATVEVTRRNADPMLIAHVCPSCAPESTVELEVMERIVNRKKPDKEILHSVGIWTYPGMAWVILQKLFPNRIPDPDDRSVM